MAMGLADGCLISAWLSHALSLSEKCLREANSGQWNRPDCSAAVNLASKSGLALDVPMSRSTLAVPAFE